MHMSSFAVLKSSSLILNMGSCFLTYIQDTHNLVGSDVVQRGSSTFARPVVRASNNSLGLQAGDTNLGATSLKRGERLIFVFEVV